MAVPLIAAVLPVLGSIIGDTVKRYFPDPDEARRVEGEITLALLAKQTQLQAAASDIIQAEAKSEHWLTSTWRPILMLTFAGLITARWLGFSAPNLSEAEVVKLWSIVEIGVGGYVIDRSAEKILPGVAGALKGK